MLGGGGGDSGQRRGILTPPQNFKDSNKKKGEIFNLPFY